MSPDQSKVGVVMGSDSDLPIMKQAIEVLRDFDIPYEFRVLSAHRTPHKAVEFVMAAADRGIEVIIAGAGGAAHLPGVIAALTHLPVIGVPIKSSSLSGLDSLLSIVQMPGGIPVATVGINGAPNAALMAAQILGIKYPEIAEKIKKYRMALKSGVEEKDRLLQEIGPEAYLKKLGK